MDRRLPIRPATWSRSIARRELALEQRLDQLGKWRPRSQRFLNPPCCADTGPELDVFTYTIGPVSIDTDAWPESSDGVSFDPVIPAGFSITDTFISHGTVTGGLDGAFIQIMGSTLESEILYVFDLLADTETGTPHTATYSTTSLKSRMFPTIDDPWSVSDLLIVLTIEASGTYEDVVDSWTPLEP